MFKKVAIFLCFVLPALAHGSDPADSLRVSLLTCSPGQEVYALYGHTAIRVETQTPSGSPLQGENQNATTISSSPYKGEVGRGSEDIVFNYGIFSFAKPHFVWRFVLGQCDYMVQSFPWNLFVREYQERGSSITAQELNLTPQEAQRLVARLRENCLPENCEYRYNFLYNNCTTKVRDMVEQAVSGYIQYPDSLPRQTSRQVLHQYTAEHPWAQEGNDLLLGAEVDTLLSDHAAMFIPESMMQAYDGAFICTPKGDQRPLVRNKTVLLESRPVAVSSKKGAEGGSSSLVSLFERVGERFTPIEVMLAFAAVCLFVMLLEAWTRRLFWLWDVLLLLLQGAAGTLLAFMLLFSEHPAVGSNWQVWLLNPVALIGIPLVIRAAVKHETTLWYAFQFVMLASFLLFSPWIPQEFAKITVPLALCLLTRPASYYLLRNKRQKPVGRGNVRNRNRNKR